MKSRSVIRLASVSAVASSRLAKCRRLCRERRSNTSALAAGQPQGGGDLHEFIDTHAPTEGIDRCPRRFPGVPSGVQGPGESV